jgi:hypothetical protein
VIGERIGDKFAASRKKGMWMGGYMERVDPKREGVTLRVRAEGLVSLMTDLPTQAAATK